MIRDRHVFQFTGGEISTAAAKECEYHRKRVSWWKAEQEKAIDLARSKGVEVREYAVTGGKSVEVVLDPTLTMRLGACATKINSHQTAADKFQIEADCYRTQSLVVYELHPDDVVYFRLAGGPRDD